MQNLSQQKPYRLAGQNNKNILQDFDSTLELPAETCAEKSRWRRTQKKAHFRYMSVEGTNIQEGARACPPEKFCKFPLKYM